MYRRLFRLFSVTLVCMLILSMFSVAQPAGAAPDLFGNPSTTVFINEIHYDNAGTDTGEAIEVAGPAGTDLTGWSIVLYNGANGLVYNTTALSGTIPNQQGGYGTVVVNYPSNGIQNGSPDGIALVNGTTLVQFLSYEGAFAGVGGPADGVTSTDIGVSEPSDTAIGNSLQLTGSGTTYGDFSWASGAANTFGAPNTGQSFGGGPTAAALVINEVDYDQPGTDTAEFVEIRNNDAGTVDLSAYSLQFVNGNGGAVYDTISLPAVSLASGGYFVVCANAATVANCDLDDGPDTNFIQNGAPDAVALYFGSTLVDVVSYEGDTVAPYVEGSGSGLEDGGDGSISRCPDGADTDQNNVDFLFTSSITPGGVNSCPPPPPVEMCGDSFTPIYTIQGNGLASALDGSEVSTEGVVVGDFQDGKGGFFLQDPAGDGNPATSDGIFVFHAATDVSVGDSVRVRGTVDEFFNLTEITDVSQVWSCSTGASVAPTALSLPVASLDDFEPYEGMLVTFPQTLYISEFFNFDRFGEIVLTSDRQFQPTAVFEPGSTEAADLALANSLGRITLDDGRGNQNPDPAIHPNGGVFDLTNLFRGGDTVANVTGALDYSFGLYRVQPTQGADYTSVNPRTAQPDDVGGNLTVASFNVLNYFTTLDNSGPICGPLSNQGCRGADNATEFTRQRDKIIAALAAMDADVVGLIEIENHPADVPTADLVSGLNDVMGAGTYDYIATGAIGTDAIRQAFIYKPASVSLVGGYAILDDPSFTDPLGYGEEKSRPALAQTFMDNTTGGVFTAVVNHLKSKGSSCGAGDDDPEAGSCNLTRALGAQALVDWLATDPTGSGDEDFLIIGDLNAYDKEDPIDALVAGGYADLVRHYQGEFAYSYVFDGQLGYLDHALANPGMMDEVTGVTVWHINSDEPDLIDYDTSFKRDAQDAIYAPDAYRSSDHDPVIVGLDVCDEIAPTFDEVSVTPNVLWPPKHQYVQVTANVVVSDNFDPNPTVELISVVSNEPDNGLGDGDTPDDIVIVDDFTVMLRAERSALGTGRTYTLTYKVTDACGNEAYTTVTVFVPLNQRSK